MGVFDILGSSPINSAVTAGLGKFTSLFRDKPSGAYMEDAGRYPRRYVTTRGILIDKSSLEKNQFDKGYFFQFNPAQIQDIKSTLYEVRPYAGLSYNDYIWSNGGERIITFQLFLDNTPQSKTSAFRPTAFGFPTANTVRADGVTFGKNGEIKVKRSLTDKVKMEFGVDVNKGDTALSWNSEGAWSNSRVSERGILDEVELIQSYLRPAAIDGEATPKFSEGGIISATQFRPPSTVVFSMGPFYLEGIIKSAPVTYTLFDSDLTPLRGTVDIEFAVFEYENINKVEIPTK